MKLDIDVSLNLKANITKRLKGFRAYTNEIEVKFENDIHNLAEKYGLKNTEIEYSDDRITKILMSEEYRNISDVFIETYRSSTLISVYSFLENSMRSFCDIVHVFNEHPIGLRDLAGDGIERSKIYLEKLEKIDFNEINGTWANIKNLNLLRNCIVHTEGDTLNFRNETKIKHIVSGNKYLSLKRDREIVIEREYIDFIINEVEVCINFLFLKLFHC